jgi:predicted alpha/beta superfamily hydrolase
MLRLVQSYRSPFRPKIWLDTGTEEGDSPQQILEDLRLLRNALLEKGWRDGVDLQYWEVPGARHHEHAWAARFGMVLECLFPR